MSTIAERVAAGAAFLDENEPGWANRIDVDKLDLGSSCRCILGQLHGDYYDARDAYELVYPEELGFASSMDPDDEGYGLPLDIEYAAITDAWRELIGQRQAPARNEPTYEEIAATKRSSDV